MTTIALSSRAASRRAILANAHAAFYAATPHHPNERNAAMEEALKLTNTIHEDAEIADITKDGTTLLITLYGTFEVIALDAYGNTLKGTV